MRRKIETNLGAHIEALYSDQGYLDSFIPVIRGPVQDETKLSDPEDAQAQRMIEAGKYRK
jgi:hypothetical protein